MKVSLEENKVTIDDKVVITPDGKGYKFTYPGQFVQFTTTSQPLGSEVDTNNLIAAVEYDENYYSNGHNGLTLNESVNRAFSMVWHQMLPIGGVEDGSTDDIKNTMKAVIREGEGRSEIYKIVGGIKKAYGEGWYKGVPFSVIFENVVNGKIIMRLSGITR